MTKKKNRYFVIGAAVCAVALAFFAGCGNPSNGGEQGADASLKSLSFADGSGAALDLSPTVNEAGDQWAVTVGNSVTAITVTATPGHDKAAVSGDSGVQKPLDLGPNTLSIVITAENGAAKTYAVIVTRASLSADAEAASFRTDHAAVLALTVGAVTAAHETGVNAALAAYNALSAEAKVLAGADKILLDSLKAKIEELKTAAADNAAVTAFRAGHAAALALTVDTVAASNEGAVDAALAAHNGLTDGAKVLASGDKRLLDQLKAKITAIKVEEQAAQADREEAGAFRSDHAAVLALTADTVAVSDEDAVARAAEDYDGKSAVVKDLLSLEKSILDDLGSRIAELKAARAAADRFTAAHPAANKTVDTVTSGDEAAVNAALTAYDALSNGAKAILLPLDRAVLVALQTKIAELKTAEAAQAGANAFKTAHPAASKTVDTVTSGDEAAVNAALTAYDALGAGVKAALLPLDRAALVALQTKIAEIKTAEAAQAGANAFKTAHPAASKTVDTVTSGDEAAVNAALTAYDALSAGVKAALLPLDRAALEALQTKIAELKAAEAQANQAGANAFKTSHSATLALTADSVTAGNEAAVDAAITAYNALSAGAKALLTAEKTRLDTLKAKIDELNAPADAQAFQTGHGTFLDTDPASLTLGDAAALTTARAAYNALSAPAKDLVAAEYAKLQALEDRMETLTAAQTFKTSHAAALELDPATVTLANETIVDAARAAHDALSADVRALLTAEKALLDSLKAAILLQKTFGSAAITITNGQMEDEDFGLEPLNLYKGDGAAERQAAFVLEAGYTAIRWSVDAADLDWADNETTFVFDAANWSVGNHTLGVTVEKGGRSWSKNISIAVSDGTRL